MREGLRDGRGSLLGSGLDISEANGEGGQWNGMVLGSRLSCVAFVIVGDADPCPAGIDAAPLSACIYMCVRREGKGWKKKPTYTHL